jgi:heat shock protein HtpX
MRLRILAAGFQSIAKETHQMATTSRSTFAATLKTVVLLAALGGILIGAGYLIGGPQVALIFLFLSVLINMGSWFFSDKLALRMSRAQPISESEDPRLYQMVRDLTTRAGLPMPKLYVIPQEQPNAFATGRNPDHSAVAVTAGIRKLLSEDELRGVLAHELGHVRNRDILLTSVVASIAAAITWIGYMALWVGGDDDSPLGIIGPLLLWILAPIAAAIMQMAISRQREYAADATGAEICGNPESLASALLRLESGAEAMPMQVNAAAEPLYIVKPFSAGGIASLFSTHPPIEERVRRLRQMRPTIG